MSGLLCLSRHCRPGDNDIPQVGWHILRRDESLMRPFSLLLAHVSCLLLRLPELVGGRANQGFIEQGERKHIGGFVLLAILLVQYLDLCIVCYQQRKCNGLLDMHRLHCAANNLFQQSRRKRPL